MPLPQLQGYGMGPKLSDAMGSLCDWKILERMTDHHSSEGDSCQRQPPMAMLFIWEISGEEITTIPVEERGTAYVAHLSPKP